jgi:hypothetical protein
MTDRRLSEDYIPIEAISAEACRENSICKERISAEESVRHVPIIS